MSGFKTTLMDCQHCGRRIMIRPADAERGSITCSHSGCGALNSLHTTFYYDKNVVRGLPGFGQLTYAGEPQTTYPLRFGPNVIGLADDCTIRVDRFSHKGRCFISRRHCTLTVTFDKWTGQLRYQLQDGAVDAAAQTVRASLNGTLLDGRAVQKTELVDVGDDQLISLGGADSFRLTHFVIDSPMLNTYKIDLAFNPDRTQ